MKSVLIFGLAAVAVVASAIGLTSTAPAAAPAATNATNATSTSFAGYVAAVTGSVTATTNFKVEVITCSATSEGMAPGVVLLNTANSVASGGSVNESCTSGTPAYSAVAVINNVVSTLPLTVSAGDKIAITIAVSSTATSVKIIDGTTHIGRSAVGAGGTPNALNIGIAAISQSGTLLGVPTFLTERFNNTKVNGAALSTTSPVATDRVSSGSVVQIRTGKLNPTGVGFSETFKKN
jgi:hypothetical protein